MFPGRSGSPNSNFAATPAKPHLDAGSPHGWRKSERASDTAVSTAISPRRARLGAVEGAYRWESAIEARRRRRPMRGGSKASRADVIMYPARA